MLSDKRTVWGAGMRRLRSLTGSIPVPRTSVIAVHHAFHGPISTGVN
jgi:hypothetical protein